MDTWSVTCQSCSVEYKVKAFGAKEAINIAKAEHEHAAAEAIMFRCDLGPMMTHAFNLTHPTHPCTPKEW